MRWLFATCVMIAILALGVPAQAQKGCTPSQYQLCLDLPPAERLQELDVSKTDNSPQQFQQLKPGERVPDPHDRRMKLDDNTSVGLGRGGVGIKRSF